jgi:hypothetical protein
MIAARYEGEQPVPRDTLTSVGLMIFEQWKQINSNYFKYVRVAKIVGLATGEYLQHLDINRQLHIPFIKDDDRGELGLHDAGRILVQPDKNFVLLHNFSSAFLMVPTGFEDDSRYWIAKVIEEERIKTCKQLAPLFSALVNFPPNNPIFTETPTVGYSLR